MIARFGTCVLLVSMVIVLCGCSECTEEVQETVSPDGRTIVSVFLDNGCGFPTVGHSTHVFLERRNRVIPFLKSFHGIASIGRAPTVKPTWESDKLLTIRVTPDRGSYRIAWRKTEALGITIRWVVTEKNNDYEPDSVGAVPQPKPSDTRTVHP